MKKRNVKRIVTLMLAVIMCVFIPTNFVACTPRDEILRIYNWGQYMSQETLDGFAQWYKNHPQGGGKIKVKEVTFDTNEKMYGEIVDKQSDFDLICPSDYMLERMINNEKLIPLWESTQQIVADSMYEGLNGLIEYDPDYTYSMPYIWGTLGIMYNAKSTTKTIDQMSTWKTLFPSTGATDKIYMKDSVRDSYAVAMLSFYSDDLYEVIAEYGYGSDEHKQLVDDAVNSISISPDGGSIQIAKRILQAQNPYVKKYEIDDAKNSMSIDEDGTSGEFGLFWSCDAGYVLSEEEESRFSCGGSSTTGINKNLRYVVPNEGSNVWVDGFAIPNTAKNIKGANLFIQYLCEQEQGYNNMVYTGGTTSVKSAMNQYKLELEADYEFFEGNEEFRTMYMDMLFPSLETLKRCKVMRDTQYMDELMAMWRDVSF